MSDTPAVWPDMEESHPLKTFHQELTTLLSEEPAHNIWGITLSPDPNHFSTKLVLQKFLRANKGDKEAAKKQLEETLKWRRGYFDESGKVIGSWDESKFQNLAFITKETVKDAGAEKGKEVIVTWNIYGHVKDFTKTFGDVEEFLRWRVELMERSIKLLDLASAKEPIPDWNSEKPTVDPYQSMQVHDYLQVSFFRTPAEVKNASKKTIEVFQKYYPELLEKKFFVNVPVIMGWVYSAMKLLIAKETFKKLYMLSYGQELAKHMGSQSVPTVYGGQGEPLGGAALVLVEDKDDNSDTTEAAPAETTSAETARIETAPTETVPVVEATPAVPENTDRNIDETAPEKQPTTSVPENTGGGATAVEAPTVPDATTVKPAVEPTVVQDATAVELTTTKDTTTAPVVADVVVPTGTAPAHPNPAPDAPVIPSAPAPTPADSPAVASVEPSSGN